MFVFLDPTAVRESQVYSLKQTGNHQTEGQTADGSSGEIHPTVLNMNDCSWRKNPTKKQQKLTNLNIFRQSEEFIVFTQPFFMNKYLKTKTHKSLKSEFLSGTDYVSPSAP